MKAIFLCKNTDKIFRVFDAQCASALSALTGVEQKIYTKTDIEENPAAFAEVEIALRYSACCSGETPPSRRSSANPMTEFSGVRISWLMLERKAVLALLDSSASESASLSARFLSSASRVS